MESVDMIAQNIEKIGALFPNCITETIDENGNPKKAINFEILKQMLSDDVIEGDEAYEFTWVGKKLPWWRLIDLLEKLYVHALRKA